MMDRIQRVKTIVREWLLENSDILDVHGVQTEMVADNEDYLRIILETEDRMGEIVVEDAGLLRIDPLKSKLLKSLRIGLKS